MTESKGELKLPVVECKWSFGYILDGFNTIPDLVRIDRRRMSRCQASPF